MQPVWVDKEEEAKISKTKSAVRYFSLLFRTIYRTLCLVVSLQSQNKCFLSSGLYKQRSIGFCLRVMKYIPWTFGPWETLAVTHPFLAEWTEQYSTAPELFWCSIVLLKHTCFQRKYSEYSKIIFNLTCFLKLLLISPSNCNSMAH